MIQCLCHDFSRFCVRVFLSPSQFARFFFHFSLKNEYKFMMVASPVNIKMIWEQSIFLLDIRWAMSSLSRIVQCSLHQSNRIPNLWPLIGNAQHLRTFSEFGRLYNFEGISIRAVQFLISISWVMSVCSGVGFNIESGKAMLLNFRQALIFFLEL